MITADLLVSHTALWYILTSFCPVTKTFFELKIFLLQNPNKLQDIMESDHCEINILHFPILFQSFLAYSNIFGDSIETIVTLNKF